MYLTVFMLIKAFFPKFTSVFKLAFPGVSFIKIFVFKILTLTDFLWMHELTTFYCKFTVTHIVKFTSGCNSHVFSLGHK